MSEYFRELSRPRLSQHFPPPAEAGEFLVRCTSLSTERDFTSGDSRGKSTGEGRGGRNLSWPREVEAKRPSQLTALASSIPRESLKTAPRGTCHKGPRRRLGLDPLPPHLPPNARRPLSARFLAQVGPISSSHSVRRGGGCKTQNPITPSLSLHSHPALSLRR
eukprot:scaffold89935_cov29-Tisochrysis_lutea.AAC.1